MVGIWEVRNPDSDIRKDGPTPGGGSNVHSTSSPMTKSHPPNPSDSLQASTSTAATTTTSPSGSYWDYAYHSFSAASSSVSNMLSSFYNRDYTATTTNTTEPVMETTSPPSFFQSLFLYSASTCGGDEPIRKLSSIGESDYEDDPSAGVNEPDEYRHFLAGSTPKFLRRKSAASSWAKIKSPTADLVWMFRNNKNPYNSVRGRDTEHTSMTAVRSLVALMPTKHHNHDIPDSVPSDRLLGSNTYGAGRSLGHVPEADEHRILFPESWESKPDRDDERHDSVVLTPPPPPPPLTSPLNELTRERSFTEHSGGKMPTRLKKAVSPSETASQLAEGTIRALRDLALDEAVELQTALQYWNIRWERPLLSWLESGPSVWMSRHGYNHQEIGGKVSQIQAVLARRCAAIGELQQHLLRAGWQRGVAQWGMLGHGGQWAAVAGFDGSIPEPTYTLSQHSNHKSDIDSVPPFASEISSSRTPPSERFLQREISDSERAPLIEDSLRSPEISRGISAEAMRFGLPRPSSKVGLGGANVTNAQKARRRTSQAQIFVGKKHGDGIFIEDPEFLAEWSVEAIALVRRHLFRAGNGKILIPCTENWKRREQADPSVDNYSGKEEQYLPLWADVIVEQQPPADQDNELLPADHVPEKETKITITNLPLMVAEVEELLDVMEDLMNIQRNRRLRQLQPPTWIRRNWYVLATAIPSFAFIMSRMKGYSRDVMKFLAGKGATFFKERVQDPIVAIFKEVWQGRESFSDEKAILEATESLKKMIRSWLDDTYPDMAEPERRSMAEAMDVTLIERKKEESMKTFYEINNVVRMSFIEMQYMKREMMYALHAMDEMMSANDINMNIAAITPAVMLIYASMRIFRFFFYALLRPGESREEIYATFRFVLTDIERLLVMRFNPPNPSLARFDTGDQVASNSGKPSVLCSDDLGMLMLLIHECRNIIWRNKRRFSPSIIQSVSEDLAELAGERGAVSVEQQLRIVDRMCRTYPFLKVISTGHLFAYRYGSLEPEVRM